MIDKMKLSDLTHVAKLVEQLGYDNRNLEQRFQQTNGALLVARDADNRAIGFAHITAEVTTLTNDPRAKLTALVVDEKHRNQKHGKALLQAAEVWAKQNGFTQLRLTSNIKRELAHRFYERNGYQVEKTRLSLSKSLE